MLQRVSIGSCPSLMAFSPRGELPSMLKHLEIINCPKLESVADRFQNDASLEHIEAIFDYLTRDLPCKLSSDMFLSHLVSHKPLMLLWQCLFFLVQYLIFPIYELGATFSFLELDTLIVDLDAIEVLAYQNTVALVILNPGILMKMYVLINI
ncbi:hypothetical protein GH714_000514 [Hevea brasiliensis]|uniref:Uncharacterized protein n=1 Tax=Hevea brasiliensis TaxID=3981 RepID=A0A6A6KHR8_HEVBR|nr:hypothetical protein GH714_000514 [Hevea brasiliensis]